MRECTMCHTMFSTKWRKRCNRCRQRKAPKRDQDTGHNDLCPLYEAMKVQGAFHSALDAEQNRRLVGHLRVSSCWKCGEWG
ncbi:unnamed protein product, partial [Mesorhabditis spiculigera]